MNIGTTQNGLSIFVSNDSIGLEDFVNGSRPGESRLCNSNEKKNVMARVVDKFITPLPPSHSSLTPPIRGLKKGSKGRLFD